MNESEQFDDLTTSDSSMPTPEKATMSLKDFNAGEEPAFEPIHEDDADRFIREAFGDALTPLVKEGVEDFGDVGDFEEPDPRKSLEILKNFLEQVEDPYDVREVRAVAESMMEQYNITLPQLVGCFFGKGGPGAIGDFEGEEVDYSWFETTTPQEWGLTHSYEDCIEILNELEQWAEEQGIELEDPLADVEYCEDDEPLNENAYSFYGVESYLPPKN